MRLQRFAEIAVVALSLVCLLPAVPQTADSAKPEVVDGTGIITTYAGNGSCSFAGDGSKATVASICNPHGIAFFNGNMYFADTGNNVIREINTNSGVISTYAGVNPAPHPYCGDNGPATSACLNAPADIVFDSQGNLYIADQGNNRIRKVDTKGMVTTYAGTGTSGFNGDGGPALEADLNSPDGLAIDLSSNNLYVADSGNHAVREVLFKTGDINTFAGTGTSGNSGDGGPAIDAELNAPQGMFFNALDNSLYIADPQNFEVRVVNSSKIIATFAGTGTQGGFTPGATGCSSGKATMTNLSNVADIRFDTTGNAYFTNYFNYGPPYGFSQVCKVDTSGKISIVAGVNSFGFSGDNGPADKAQLWLASFLAFDQSGNLYVADTVNKRIRKVTEAIAPIPTFIPAPGTYHSAQSVTIMDAVADATFHCTTDGSTPSISSPECGGSILVTDTTTIKAIAIAKGYQVSAVGTGPYRIVPFAATPGFTPPPGTYTSIQKVTITSSTADATIYCTTNGSAPTTASTKYTGPITVSSTETLECIAVAPNYAPSAVAVAKYIIDLSAATPVIQPASGPYAAPLKVTITDADASRGATIYYTTNGTAPTTSSTKYTGPISVLASETIEAMAEGNGYTESALAKVTYTIESLAATPVLTPAAGVYESVQTIAMTTATPGATIYYTTDGTTPTTSSIVYTTPVTVSSSETIKAIAVASGYLNSALASAAYRILGSPYALAAPATSISAPDATLNAVVNTLGLTGSCYFQYGTSSNALTSTTPTITLGSDANPVAASSKLTTLKSKTTYYFQVVVTTAGGNGFSRILRFTTD